MSDRFYREFEERYYAPREVIKELRIQYLPFVEPLAKLYSEEQTYDAGCGRGEWLELMSDLGFTPFGVDLDEGMLEACRERDLAIHHGDAISYLSSLSDESQAVVSAFHVVEHISFEQLRIFVREALRVLKPGGVLIMETPNPENIVVATRNFYLDPTHVRPIPSMLLSFITEYAGFKKVKTLRLQESKQLLNKVSLSLSDVINGVSPDYAIVAQKDASEDILSLTSHAFDREYGLSLDSLLSKWDNRFNIVEAKTEQAQAKAEQAENKAQQAENKAQQAENKAQQAENKAEDAHKRTHHFEQTITAIYTSRSWRITYPMRWSFHQARLLREHGVKSRSKALVRKVAKPVLNRAFHYVDGRPKLRQKLLTILRKLGFYARFKSIYLNRYPNQSADIQHTSHLRSLDKVSNLSPRAQQIYNDLKTAIERNKEK